MAPEPSLRPLPRDWHLPDLWPLPRGRWQPAACWHEGNLWGECPQGVCRRPRGLAEVLRPGWGLPVCHARVSALSRCHLRADSSFLLESNGRPRQPKDAHCHSARSGGAGSRQLNSPGLLPFPQIQSPGNSRAEGTHPPAANRLLGRWRLGRRAPATDSARPPRQQAASGTRVCGCPAGSPALRADWRGRGGHCRSGLDVHLRKTSRYFFASGN